jgi:hypothetical protein
MRSLVCMARACIGALGRRDGQHSKQIGGTPKLAWPAWPAPASSEWPGSHPRLPVHIHHSTGKLEWSGVRSDVSMSAPPRLPLLCGACTWRRDGGHGRGGGGAAHSWRSFCGPCCRPPRATSLRWRRRLVGPVGAPQPRRSPEFSAITRPGSCSSHRHAVCTAHYAPMPPRTAASFA